MIIRGTSESSGPEQIAISFKSESTPTQGNSPESVNDLSVCEKSTLAPSSSTEDIVSIARNSIGEDKSEKSLVRTESAGSNASSGSVGSITRKPPTLPKPHSLSVKIKGTHSSQLPQLSNKSETLPMKSTPICTPSHKYSSTTSSNTPSLHELLPPPKPARNPSKSATDTPNSSPNRIAGNESTSIVSIPQETNGTTPKSESLSPRQGSRPPPKPVRPGVKDSQGNNKPVSSSSSNVNSSTSPKPPPKPRRVKVPDPMSQEGKSRTLDASLGDVLLKQDYISTTLPSRFKPVWQQKRTVTDEATGSRPIPKPKISLGATQATTGSGSSQ